jgi:hypothetical protein
VERCLACEAVASEDLGKDDSIGGLAMNELGLVRVTEDIDLLIEPSIENQELIRQALRILPERAIDELRPEEDLRDWVVVRVHDEITVDLMTSACGVSYPDGIDDVSLGTISGIEIPFANRDLMIRLKQGNREKDRIDLEYSLRTPEL